MTAEPVKLRFASIIHKSIHLACFRSSLKIYIRVRKKKKKKNTQSGTSQCLHTKHWRNIKLWFSIWNRSKVNAMYKWRWLGSSLWSDIRWPKFVNFINHAKGFSQETWSLRFVSSDMEPKFASPTVCCFKHEGSNLWLATHNICGTDGIRDKT